MQNSTEETSSSTNVMFAFKSIVKRSNSPVRGNDDYSATQFFDQIISNLKKAKIPSILDNIAFILVCHMAPTLYLYLEAIQNIGRIALIIPKGMQRSSAKQVCKYLENYQPELYKTITQPLQDFDMDFNDPDYYKKYVNHKDNVWLSTINSGEKFIIVDIGGYFAEFYERIGLDREILSDKRFLGIVEDTENGHQKYEKAISNLQAQGITSDIPIYSVARSLLKKTEDYNVGKSIVEATGTILRTQAHTMLERMVTAGVIGFGKIGKSIAEHLRQKNLKEVVVYDPDIIRQMEASSLGFKTVDRPYLICNSNIIFCATGNKSLKCEDLNYFQDNLFIASCTSRDDEFDYGFLQAFSDVQNGDVCKITYKDKRVILIDNGNAVNFIYGAVNGPYIYSVQAGLIYSIFKVINCGYVKEEEESPSKKLRAGDNTTQTELIQLKELDTIDMEKIALTWQRCFDQYDTKIDIHIEKFIVEFNPTAVKDSQENTKEHFKMLIKYLENRGYLYDKELNQLIELINGIMVNWNKDKLRLILDNIDTKLSSNQFCYLMRYFCDFLIYEISYISEDKKNYDNEKLELCILRAFSDSVVYISNENKSITRTKSFEELKIELLQRSYISPKSVSYLSNLFVLQENSGIIVKENIDTLSIIKEAYKRFLEKEQYSTLRLHGGV